MYRLCGVAIGLGALLLWRGITGDIWRSSFTGEAMVPRWLYIASGIFLFAGGIGLYVAMRWLIKSQS